MKITLADGRVIKGNKKNSLLDTLQANGIFLTASCGGKGTCGKCRIELLEGDLNIKGFGKLTQEERSRGIALACQSYPEGDITINIPKESMLTVGDQIAISRTRDLFESLLARKAKITPLVTREKISLPPPTLDDHISDLERLKRSLSEREITLDFPHDFVLTLADRLRKENWEFTLLYQKESGRALGIEPLNGGNGKYGLAIDIGTTTVVLYLVDLSDGRVVDVSSTYNSQMRYGDDVITRIVNATEGGKLQELRKAVVTDINDLLKPLLALHQIRRDDIESVVISGNTTMTHLFWGLNPAYIREEPYIPTINRFPVWEAGDSGIRVMKKSPVYTIPNVASYVGGDIVAGVLATGMHRSSEISLLMDIGTNGEIVIGNNEWLMTAACSAGPCFEGSGIRSGMRASPGAIEDIKINRETLEPEIKVIGNSEPMGICGSGMIDAVSEMLLSGIMNQKGQLIKESSPERVREGEEGLEYLIHSTGKMDIVLTQVDIENIIRAKAAIFAGVNLLLGEVGLTTDMIEKVYIAGGFGNFLDTEKAIILGML
ncbi:MAG: DUF4445 domain-containing protein, partial [Nitrospirae bacterium]